MSITYEQFMADFGPAANEMVGVVHELIATEPIEVVVASLLELAGGASKKDLVGAAVALLLTLADEQAAHAKTKANFEEYAESSHEENELLRAELDAVRAQLAEVAT